MKIKKISYKKLSFIGIPMVIAIIALILILNGVFSDGSSVKASGSDLMKDSKSEKVNTVELKEEFLKSTSDFSVDLFKQTYKKGENSLLSPTSVYLALGMVANGADGNTLKEFENVLGKYGASIKDLNTSYHSFSQELTKNDSGKLKIANSIWYNQGNSLNIKKEFLQTNANYYNASAYKADFNNPQTVKDINSWVKLKTGNTIDKIINNIEPNTKMYLINAMYFENQWEKIYSTTDVSQDNFKLESGVNKSTDFMLSTETTFLKDDKAEGFIKPYKDGKYSFVAILPNPNISIDSYISSLSGESFMNFFKNREISHVHAAIPRFKTECSIDLIEPLKKLGLKDCFDSEKSNFTKMDSGKTCIGGALQKTYISVDTKGTKAGAVTVIATLGMSMTSNSHEITLNRPFVYAIVDNETNLPLFIGTMMNP